MRKFKIKKKAFLLTFKNVTLVANQKQKIKEMHFRFIIFKCNLVRLYKSVGLNESKHSTIECVFCELLKF